MLQTILKYLWDHRTTVLGYVVTTLGIMATSDLFTMTQVKWMLLINGIVTGLLGHYNNSTLPKGPPQTQGGFIRAAMLGVLLALATVSVLTLSGCTANPVREAETFEQKSFALYGSYVIFQSKAAELVQESTTPEKVKEALRAADRVSYPVSVTLIDAALEVGEIRDTLNACPTLPEPDPKCVPTNEQKLANAITNLSSIYFSAQPKLLALVTAVKEAK